MPRVKIDYVVSFSSEDPDNPASNLLAWDVSKKRWLCSKGEPSCSVVLQLPRAVKISAVHVGAHHSALVEVLVGRSEKPNEPFQVLVPSCIFLSPAESRKDAGVERVRSFSADQLASPARDQRWDRVRVVCSQPYNKHCKYGLNFVHISEPEGVSSASVPAPSVPAVAPASALPAGLALLGDAGSSSDDEFRPGELFAKHKSPATDTGAQIRQATSQALKNISHSATKLVKTPMSKQTKRQTHSDEPSSSNRQRDRGDLMYTDDDDQPHAKIDHIVQRHKDEVKKTTEKKHDRKSSNESSNDKKESQSDKRIERVERTPKDDRKNRPDPTSRVSKDEPSTSSSSRDKSDRDDNDRKSTRDDKHGNKVGGDFNSIMKGVVFVMSGYVNPQRAMVRDLALEMGARYERDWGPQCNHLICAFPNTPKLKAVRSGPGGARVPAARAAWVQQSHRARRRLPWRWFATEPPGGGAPHDTQDHGGESDTDDEIERAMRKQKKRRTDHSPSPPRDKRDRSNSSKRAKRDADASTPSRDRDANESTPSRDRDANVSTPSRDRDANVSTPSRDRDANVSTPSRDRDANVSTPSRDRDANVSTPSRDRDANVSTPSRDRDANVSTPSRDRDANVSTPSRDRDANVSNSSRNDAANVSNASDVVFVRDERMQGNVTVEDSDDEKMDEEDGGSSEERIDKTRALPDLFSGSTFVIDASVSRADFDAALLARYVRAYGGIVMEASQLDDDSSARYVLSARASERARAVRPDWLWRCHAEKRLHPVQEYLLT